MFSLSGSPGLLRRMKVMGMELNEFRKASRFSSGSIGMKSIVSMLEGINLVSVQAVMPSLKIRVLTD